MSVISWFKYDEGSKLEKLEKFITHGQSQLSDDYLKKVKEISIENQWQLVSEIWPKLYGKSKEQLVEAVWKESFYFLFHYIEKRKDRCFLAIELLGHLPNKIIVEYLLKLFRHRDDNIKLAAAGAIAHQPPELVLPLLLEALQKPTIFVPARIGQAIIGFGQIGIDKMVLIYDQVDDNTKESIIDLLAEVKGFQGEEILEKALTSTSADIRGKAIITIQNLGFKKLSSNLRALLRDDVAKVRGLAAQALGLFRVQDAIEELKELQEDQDYRVQVWAREAIRLMESS